MQSRGFAILFYIENINLQIIFISAECNILYYIPHNNIKYYHKSNLHKILFINVLLIYIHK